MSMSQTKINVHIVHSVKLERKNKTTVQQNMYSSDHTVKLGKYTNMNQDSYFSLKMFSELDFSVLFG